MGGVARPRVTEIEWETKMRREDAAALLRRLADGLESGKKVELEHGGLELKLGVAEEVDLEIEVELNGEETEVEIELGWSTGGEERKASVADEGGADASEADDSASAPDAADESPASTAPGASGEGSPLPPPD